MNVATVKDFFHIFRQWPSGTTLVVVVLLIAWAFWAHFAGFAHADEVEKELNQMKADIAALKEDITIIKDDGQASRREALEAQMFSVRVDQCAATGALKHEYGKRLADLEIKYLRAGGSNYRLPLCDEL